MRKRLVSGAVLAAALFTLPIRAADAPIARVPAVTEQSTDPAVKEMFETARTHGIKPINLQLVMALAPALSKPAEWPARLWWQRFSPTMRSVRISKRRAPSSRL